MAREQIRCHVREGGLCFPGRYSLIILTGVLIPSKAGSLGRGEKTSDQGHPSQVSHPSQIWPAVCSVAQPVGVIVYKVFVA